MPSEAYLLTVLTSLLYNHAYGSCHRDPACAAGRCTTPTTLLNSCTASKTPLSSVSCTCAERRSYSRYSQHVADAQGPASATSGLFCPWLPPDAQITAKESETPEQALQRRMKESARVEERVTQIYTAQDFRHQLEQVLLHLAARQCQALLVVSHQSLPTKAVTIKPKNVSAYHLPALSILPQAPNWVYWSSEHYFQEQSASFHCTCRPATI